MPTFSVRCQECGKVWDTGPETVMNGGVCPACGFRHEPGKPERYEWTTETGRPAPIPSDRRRVTPL